MMKNKYVFVACMLSAILILGMGLTNIYVRYDSKNSDTNSFTVVTSFYPIYIMVMNIAKDVPGVTVRNLSEPQTGCLHDFQLTPEDMKLLSQADVFVINGGGIESFMEEIAQDYPRLTVIEACEYIELLTDGEEVNAHAWMSVPGYRGMVRDVALGLSEADPAHRADYEANERIYDDSLAPLELRLDAIKNRAKATDVILFHEAYEYVADDLGMQVKYCLDLDEERQVSAGEIADVLGALQGDGVSLIFAEELYGKGMSELVKKESNATVLYLDALNRGDYKEDSYLEGMGHNLDLLEQYFGVE